MSLLAMAHNMTNFSSQRYRTSAELRAKINWNSYKSRDKAGNL
jgi:hypothetical protein